MIEYVAYAHEIPVEKLASVGTAYIRPDGYIVAGFEELDAEDSRLIAAFLRINGQEYGPMKGYDGITSAYEEDRVLEVGQGNFYKGSEMILVAFSLAQAEDIIDHGVRPYGDSTIL